MIQPETCTQCDCTIVQSPGDDHKWLEPKYSIDYCPLHTAAPETAAERDRLQTERELLLEECSKLGWTIDRLRDALQELLEVGDLRGDTTLPNPADDPILWTARMQEAWDEARRQVAP